MDTGKALAEFFSSIEKDPRISPTHICIYASLLQYGNVLQANPILLYSHELMKLAKISSGKTYYKIMRELSQYGYLRYEPSFHRNQRSKVYLSEGEFGRDESTERHYNPMNEKTRAACIKC